MNECILVAEGLNSSHEKIYLCTFEQEMIGRWRDIAALREPKSVLKLETTGALDTATHTID